MAFALGQDCCAYSWVGSTPNYGRVTLGANGLCLREVCFDALLFVSVEEMTGPWAFRAAKGLGLVSSPDVLTNRSCNLLGCVLGGSPLVRAGLGSVRSE